MSNATITNLPPVCHIRPEPEILGKPPASSADDGGPAQGIVQGGCVTDGPVGPLVIQKPDAKPTSPSDALEQALEQLGELPPGVGDDVIAQIAAALQQAAAALSEAVAEHGGLPVSDPDEQIIHWDEAGTPIPGWQPDHLPDGPAHPYGTDSALESLTFEGGWGAAAPGGVQDILPPPLRPDTASTSPGGAVDDSNAAGLDVPSLEDFLRPEATAAPGLTGFPAGPIFNAEGKPFPGVMNDVGFETFFPKLPSTGDGLLNGKTQGLFFEDMVAAFMMKVMEESQAEVQQMMEAYDEGAAASPAAGTGAGATGQSANTDINSYAGQGTADVAADGSESRTMMMEKLKMAIQEMQQIQQALSNTLNSMHQNAMSTVRNIK